MERVVWTLTLNICQIVGYKNSGKTTLTGNVIKEMQEKGKSVGSIKHHGHFETDPLLGGDSGEHIKSGSIGTTLITPAFAHMSYQKEPPLRAFVAFYKALSGIDWLLIEGYKNESYPKLVMVQNQEEWQALSSISNILAVVTDHPVVALMVQGSYPAFSRRSIKGIVNFLLGLESRCEET